jgi:hydrogenase expression/formation protein HypE
MTRNARFIDERITLKYGTGGGAMRALIEQVFAKEMGDVGTDGIGLAAMDDGAAIRIGDQYLVIATDSHVVQPIEFPGGDIGRLAVSGTVNDLAMMGATEPLALTCAVIIEDGFERDTLKRIWESIRTTCEEAETTIVTGDTKVMGHGELDGLVLNTTGVALTKRLVSDAGLRAGDKILVTYHGDSQRARFGDHAPIRCRADTHPRAAWARRWRGGCRRPQRSDSRGLVERVARDGREERRRDHRGRDSDTAA